MKIAQLNNEWVAQVSLLRPGCSGMTDSEEKTRSQNRDLGHPLIVWNLQLIVWNFQFIVWSLQLIFFASVVRGYWRNGGPA
jgi:hypothetical protein